MRITVTADNGHKVELSTSTAIDGSVVAKAVAFWRGRRMPAIDLKAFTELVAAERYLRRLAAALVDRDALEEPAARIHLDPIVCAMNETPHLLTDCCYEWHLPVGAS
jgi:hypothetical protein